MKFIHISDVHLGKKPDSKYRWGQDREEELYETFEDILNICNNDKVDLLLIAGELFDKQPLTADLIRVNEMFKGLVSTKVVLVAGSKDHLAVTSNYYTFVWNENVHIFKGKDTEEVYFKDINTRVYGFSFNEKYMKEFDYGGMMECDSNVINIFIGYGGEERYAPINFEKLLGYGFDYVALGRKHNYEEVCDKVVYSGAPEPLGNSEMGVHGYVRGELIGHEGTYELVKACRRQYFNEIININSEMTYEVVKEYIDKLTLDLGKNNIYSITLEGFKHPDMECEFENILDEYNIISITDNSLPNYDFQMIYENNKDNLLGKFIDSVNKSNVEDDIKKKALYLGVEALIKQQ